MNMEEKFKSILSYIRLHLLKTLIILSTVIYSCYAYSQNSVKGRIKDNYNKSIIGAVIAMRSLNDTLFVRGCISDNNGWFQINDVPSGNYKLSVLYLGFTSYTANISLKQTIILDDIVLKEKAEELDEVVVKGNTRIEKAEKSILIPTALEKKHSINGFDLLSVMQIPELDVSSDSQSVSTVTGGEVVVCIDGMEVLQEEMKTLLSKNIQKIEYIRSPSGKYAGKAGLINIITKPKSFGGNVYVSAK